MQKQTPKSQEILKSLGLADGVNMGVYDGKTFFANGKVRDSVSPHDNKSIGQLQEGTAEDYEHIMKAAMAVKDSWALRPAPFRGEIVRQIGLMLRERKEELGALISIEMGKILNEGLGEVQEAIDMCDFACGLSRKIQGQVLPSERPGHVLMEHWNPLGLVGVITAFNFPCAVFFWNFCISMVCGNCTVWKGASSTSMITIAITKLVHEVLARNNVEPGVLVTVVGPGRSVGNLFLDDDRLKLVSFTGSTPIGRTVSEKVHKRFGSTILELGGNNSVIVMDDADFELAMKAVVFGSIGTSGQRCTSTRRVFIHESLYDKFKNKMIEIYKGVKIGNPLDTNFIMGPVHTKGAIKEYMEGLEEIKKQGGKILYGGNRIESEGLKEGNYVEPTIVEIAKDAAIVNEELFVPIVYLFPIESFEEAVKLNNQVPQGLSSSLFTKNMQNVFKWMGPTGSDCGLVNVNAGTSGAEIGGAFGGEKETGGGRESGSDAWKQYMRRSTCTVNYGDHLPLSQGLDFNL
jgi:aldehyde dehydrogenase family 7 protein A1